MLGPLGAQRGDTTPASSDGPLFSPFPSPGKPGNSDSPNFFNKDPAARGKALSVGLSGSPQTVRPGGTLSTCPGLKGPARPWPPQAPGVEDCSIPVSAPHRAQSILQCSPHDAKAWGLSCSPFSGIVGSDFLVLQPSSSPSPRGPPRPLVPPPHQGSALVGSPAERTRENQIAGEGAPPGGWPRCAHRGPTRAGRAESQTVSPVERIKARLLPLPESRCLGAGWPAPLQGSGTLGGLGVGRPS